MAQMEGNLADSLTIHIPRIINIDIPNFYGNSYIDQADNELHINVGADGRGSLRDRTYIESVIRDYSVERLSFNAIADYDLNFAQLCSGSSCGSIFPKADESVLVPVLQAACAKGSTIRSVNIKSVTLSGSSCTDVVNALAGSRITALSFNFVNIADADLVCLMGAVCSLANLSTLTFSGSIIDQVVGVESNPDSCLSHRDRDLLLVFCCDTSPEDTTRKCKRLMSAIKYGRQLRERNVATAMAMGMCDTRSPLSLLPGDCCLTRMIMEYVERPKLRICLRPFLDEENEINIS